MFYIIGCIFAFFAARLCLKAIPKEDRDPVPTAFALVFITLFSWVGAIISGIIYLVILVTSNEDKVKKVLDKIL